jgi:hypothetical protein
MSLLGFDVTYSAKDKKRVKYGIFSSGVIVVLVMAALLSRPPLLDTVPGKISVSMEAQVFRGGVLLEERVNDNDLILMNFANLTEGLFSWPNDAALSVEMTDTTGYSPDFLIWNGTSEETIFDVENSDAASECRVGDGSTAPTINDYNLDSDVWDMELDSSSQDTDDFTLTYIWVNDQGSWTWTETGLILKWWCDYGDEDYAIMLARDVFSGISVVNDDTLVVNYRFTFATGYTTNAITLYRYLLIGASEDASTSTSFTDTGGTSRTVTIYTATPTENYVCHVSNTQYGGHLLVSNNAYGIPARAAYRILGSTLQNYATVELDDSPLSVVVSAVYVPTSEITIVCAAYYRYTAYSGGAGYLMMFALTHGGVYVAAGTPVRATFTVGLS